MMEDDGKTRDQLLEELVELRRQVAERREMEDRFRGFIDNSPTIAWMKDEEGRYVYLSTSCEKQFGVRLEDWLGKTDFDVWPREIAEEFRKNDRLVLSTGQTIEVVEDTLCKDGTREYWSNCKFLFQDAAGRKYVCGVGTDITKQKRIEESLRKAKQHLEAHLANSPVAVVEFDPTFRVIRWSGEAERIFGWKPDEIVGKAITDLRWVHEDDLGLVRQVSEEMLSGQRPKNVNLNRNYRKDGSTVHCEWYNSAIYDEHGRLTSILSLVLDITGRKRIEEALRQNEERLRAVFDSAQDFIFIKDLNRRYLMINDFFQRQHQVDLSPIIGKTDAEIPGLENVETTRPVIKETDARVLRGEPVNFEITFLVSGFPVTLDIIKTPLLDANGNVKGICGIARDVTDRRNLEEELARAHKLESVGTLAGGIAHDFNNLLGVIHGYIELLKVGNRPGTSSGDMLEAALQATMQAAELTKQLITFSKGGDPVKRLCQIGEMVKETVLRSIDKATVEKEFLLDNDLWPAEIDAGQIRQVISNIVTNAIEAMPDGGLLTVRAENIVVSQEDGLPLSDGPYVKISVEDTGVGISPDCLPLLFDPYYSTKERGSQKGMGLGLSVCYSVVNKHNGHIAVESTKGKGSVFHIYLPVGVAERPQEEFQDKHAQQGPRGRVLVMDDEPVFRDMIRHLLVNKGYKVTTTNDGMNAVDFYVKARESGEPYDLVILDLTVKGGVGGKLTMERLLRIDPQVKAIILSGYPNDPVIKNYQKHGFLGTLTKPFPLRELLALVEENL
jgi:PAS domain S-box-containing protein